MKFQEHKNIEAELAAGPLLAAVDPTLGALLRQHTDAVAAGDRVRALRASSEILAYRRALEADRRRLFPRPGLRRGGR